MLWAKGRKRNKLVKDKRIPLLKPPNSQGPLENQEDPAAFQQAPTAKQKNYHQKFVYGYGNFKDDNINKA